MRYLTTNVFIISLSLHNRYRSKHQAQFFGRGHIAGVDIKVMVQAKGMCRGCLYITMGVEIHNNYIILYSGCYL